MAFFDSDLYRDVAQNWKGSGALYIFLLSSAAWVISCAATTAIPMLKAMNDPDMKGFVAQLPKLQILDGKMTIDKPAGYEIKEPKSGVALIRFAMDRKVDEPRQGDPPIVLTSNVMMVQDASAYRNASSGTVDDSAVKTYKFSELTKILPAKVEFDSASAQSMIDQVFIFLPIAILFVGWPFIFLGHLFQLLIFGGIGMLIANGMQKDMNFEKAMRLSAIAITPAVMISVLLNAMTLATPMARGFIGFWGFASIAVTFAYLIMIMRALPTAEIQPSAPTR
jgi:hypothetical protein